MTIHELKTHDTFWQQVISGEKRFEVRRNDRGFQRGDTVVLKKYEQYPKGVWHDTGERLTFKIGWILQGGQFGIEAGYCVFQLEECVNG